MTATRAIPLDPVVLATGEPSVVLRLRRILTFIVRTSVSCEEPFPFASAASVTLFPHDQLSVPPWIDLQNDQDQHKRCRWKGMRPLNVPVLIVKTT